MHRFLSRLRRALVSRFIKRTFPYRLPAGPYQQLSGEATQPVNMVVDSAGKDRPDVELYKIWQGIPGGHKWWHYFEVYDQLFSGLRDTPIRFLEVGVYQGGSLACWREYFHPDSVIVGVDIDPDCAKFEDASSNVHVRIGDQSDTQFLSDLFQEFGPFDAILDDGSHICSDMIKTFEYAFLNGLADQGVYIAEDTHSNFWRGYRDQKYSFVDLCKDLVDFSHAHYLENEDKIGRFTLTSSQRVKSISVPRIGEEIQEIRFLDSMIMIRRNKQRSIPTVEHL